MHRETSEGKATSRRQGCGEGVVQPLAALVATQCTNYRELKTFDI